jgi:hypothetical protein
VSSSGGGSGGGGGHCTAEKGCVGKKTAE